VKTEHQTQPGCTSTKERSKYIRDHISVLMVNQNDSIYLAWKLLWFKVMLSCYVERNISLAQSQGIQYSNGESSVVFH